jgi:hypothetical protein
VGFREPLLKRQRIVVLRRRIEGLNYFDYLFRINGRDATLWAELFDLLKVEAAKLISER